jgi:hypothetical protein
MHTIDADLDDKAVSGVDELLRHNETYYQLFISRPFFKMIESGVLNRDEKKRAVFFNLVQIFSDYFQTMIQSRQASCRDERFSPIFLKHFFEELGHDDLLRQRKKITNAWDPIIVAVCTWFVHQMQVLDNIEKAVVMHLVLEKTGDYYHSLGNKMLSQHTESNYFEVHAEHDEDHASMITDLLPGYPAFIYQRLSVLLKESWEMMYTMVDRVHDIVMRKT